MSKIEGMPEDSGSKSVPMPPVDDQKGCGPSPPPDDVAGHAGRLQSASKARNL